MSDPKGELWLTNVYNARNTKTSPCETCCIAKRDCARRVSVYIFGQHSVCRRRHDGGHSPLDCSGHRKVHRLLHVWSNNQLSRDLRVKLYYVRISTVLLYGSETWLLDTWTCQRLRGFHSRCMTRIFGQPAVDILRNNLGGDIIHVVQKRRWLWLGHVLWMDNSCFVRQVFDAVYPGHRQPPFPSGSLPALLPWPIHEAATRAADCAAWVDAFDNICLS